MKKIIFFILLFIANYTYSQVKVDASGGIIPTGLYPAVDGNDVKGSVHEVQSIIDRNNIPANFRRLGMLAYVVDSLKYYQLKTGITNSDWYEFKTRSGDTTLVELPLYVDTANGIRTLKILHDDGLVSGGVVTKNADDWKLDVTSAVYYIGNKAYSSPSSTVTIDTADAIYDRIDVIGVDTSGNVFLMSGIPSATPIAPQINPSSQLALTTITVKAASTLAPVITRIIYDEGTEWDTATSGTITATFNNHDNPYHATNDIYVQTYENGSSLEFTDIGQDTVTSNMILKYFFYSNGVFNNSFQIQFLNGSTPVSNSLSFNSGFGLNPNNENTYQNISIPLTSFTFSSNIFNKLKITMSGEDISGAGGYYLDYIQLQKGISQTGSGSCPLCIVDIHVSLDSTQQIAIRQNGDTASVISFGNGIDTTSLSDRINQKVNISDTASMLAPYLRNGITQAQLDDSTAAIREDFPTVTGVTQEQLDDTAQAIRADFPSGGIDSTAYHTSEIIGDSLLILCDLKNRCDTIAMSSVNIWGKNGSKIFYNEGNVGIGDDTANAKLVVRDDGAGYSRTTAKDTSGIILYNGSISGSSSPRSSPPLTFRANGYNTGVLSPNDVRVRIRLQTKSAGSNSPGDVMIENSLDGGSTWSNALTINAGSGNLTFSNGNGVNGTFITTQNATFSGTATASHIYTSAYSAVGTSSYNKYDAILQVESTDQGLLLPRMTTSQRDNMSREVTSVTITNGGSGYTSNPSITFQTSGGNKLATGTAVRTGDALTDITITNGGSYFSTPSITISGGGGSGATATANMTQSLTPGLTIYCTDCTATDSSTGVEQTWNGTTWKNKW